MRHPSLSICVAVFLVGTLLLTFNPSQAQEPTPPPAATQTTDELQPFAATDPAAGSQPADASANQDKSFEQIVSEVRSNERLINRLYSSMPIGFPKQQQESLNRIDELKKTNAVLKKEMEAAAIRAFREEPKKNRLAVQMVFRALTKKLEISENNNHFDPQGALELAEMMLETDLDAEPRGPIRMADVAYQAFLASYALDDFARADLMLKKIEDIGVPMRASMRTELSDAQEKWKRELMIRRLESNADDLPRVKFETTEGDFVVELYENHAPRTVGNFISLVERNFYNDLTFFDVKPGRIAQTGCPVNDGSGSAGYQIPCECYEDEIRHHFSGTLSMSNSGRDTGGSQFFVAHQRIGQWDGRFTVFGRVIEGMDVVRKFQPTHSEANPTEGVDPPAQTTILKATVIRKRDHEYTPSRVADKPDSNSTDGIRKQNLETADNQPSGN